MGNTQQNTVFTIPTASVCSVWLDCIKKCVSAEGLGEEVQGGKAKLIVYLNGFPFSGTATIHPCETGLICTVHQRREEANPLHEDREEPPAAGIIVGDERGPGKKTTISPGHPNIPEA